MEVLAENLLQFSASFVDHRTVRFGSGAVPKF